MKRAGLDNEIFWGLGISFAVMVGTMGVFAFIFLSAVALRGWLESYVSEGVVLKLPAPPAASVSIPASQGQPSTGSTNPLFDIFSHVERAPFISFNPAPSVPTPESELTYDVLYDLFSGTGWIDQGKTTMYQDLMMTAFVLPPQFTFERAPAAASAQFIERKADGSDVRCIGNHCLTQKGNTLLLDGKPVALPQEAQQGSLVSVSIGAFDSVWPVGIVTKNGEDYSGWLFLFDGTAFRNIQREGREVFVARYGGTIGFGGTDNDWIAVYGAYEGKAVHVQNASLTDISRFFGIRVMSGGFDPEIARVDLSGDTTWFIWNKGGAPKLVKLFENGTGAIVGGADLTQKLLGIVPNADSVHFAPSSIPHTLDAKVSAGGAVDYWRFTDQGFDNTTSREIVSASLTNRILPVKIAVIPQVELANGGGKVEFYLSNNGNDWSPANIGDKIVFADQNGDKTFWRAVITPALDKYKSAYLGMIEVNYAFKKAE